MDFWRCSSRRLRRKKISNKRIYEQNNSYSSVPREETPKINIDVDTLGKKTKRKTEQKLERGNRQKMRERELEEDLLTDKNRRRLEIGIIYMQGISVFFPSIFQHLGYDSISTCRLSIFQFLERLKIFFCNYRGYILAFKILTIYFTFI